MQTRNGENLYFLTLHRLLRNLDVPQAVLDWPNKVTTHHAEIQF